MTDPEEIDAFLDECSPADGKVLPVFYYTDEGVVTWCFECLSCERVLSWEKTQWLCKGCDFVLGQRGAGELIEDTIASLEYAYAAIPLFKHEWRVLKACRRVGDGIAKFASNVGKSKKSR